MIEGRGGVSGATGGGYRGGGESRFDAAVLEAGPGEGGGEGGCGGEIGLWGCRRG